MGHYWKAMPRWALMIRVFVMPACILIESIVYWKIRKKIMDRKMAWIHVGLVMYVCFIPVIKALMFYFFDNFGLAGGDLRASIQRVNLIYFYSFWGAVLIGHIFFIILLVTVFSRKELSIPGPESINLLDDIIN
jgi:hypothetical protein